MPHLAAGKLMPKFEKKLKNKNNETIYKYLLPAY